MMGNPEENLNNDGNPEENLNNDGNHEENLNNDEAVSGEHRPLWHMHPLCPSSCDICPTIPRRPGVCARRGRHRIHACRDCIEFVDSARGEEHFDAALDGYTGSEQYDDEVDTGRQRALLSGAAPVSEVAPQSPRLKLERGQEPSRSGAAPVSEVAPQCSCFNSKAPSRIALFSREFRCGGE